MMSVSGSNSRHALWGGRFREAPSEALTRFSRAASSHLRLVPHDIAGSRAHARELERAGLLTAGERARLIEALDGIEQAVASGLLAPGEADEDVHTFIERALMARLGPLGGKLRAGRSRNDQAANDLKLYLRAASQELSRLLRDLALALADQAERHAEAPCPGFTHLQPAQPVVFGHWLMAHAWPLSRDIARLADFRRRAGASPLGAAALAGSALAMRPDLSARELGYDRAFENSVDAVGARDHVAEFLFCCAMAAVNISRLAEEITLWASRQFAWVELPDAFATGSSIMPQKKNPDVAELMRGRSARLIGDLVAMLGACKGLPLSYNRDLGEDKHAAFDAHDVLELALPAMTGLVAGLRVNAQRLAGDAAEGFTLATEVADHLAAGGIPFAEAHEITGALVRYCEDMGKRLEALEPVDLRAVDPRLDVSLLPKLAVEAAIASRAAAGGTAPDAVRAQIQAFRSQMAEITP